MALLPVLLIRAIRPIIFLRFGLIKGARIGHAASDPEFYLCERESGVQPKSLDLFYYHTPICNRQLKRMIERNMRVFSFVSYLDRVNRFLPGGARHTILINGGTTEDEYGLLSRWPIHLSLNGEEKRRGQEGLESIGVPVGAPYVCFHFRDSAYMTTNFPGYDWSYHDFRKSSIQDYVPAIEELTQRGYYVVRMGSSVNERLSTSNPKIIDYANNYRTEFLDIYLFSKCSFYLGSTAGIFSVPAIFRKPIAFANFTPVQQRNTTGLKDLFIPKKLWLKKEERYMGFQEIFEANTGWYQLGEQYEALGIEHIENTPEEITALALEMDQRLEGLWQSSEEDEELQNRFWSVFRPNEPNGVGVPRIGARFLRENRGLLD